MNKRIIIIIIIIIITYFAVLSLISSFPEQTLTNDG